MAEPKRTDVHSPEQRRYNMSRIRGRDTRPELVLRKGLHREGLRYRLHVKELPGRPDIVFPQHHAVALVHGCFWHGHDCPMFRLPATRTEFWREKVATNQRRDEQALAALLTAGWRVLTVWECAMRGPARLELKTVIASAAAFVRGDAGTLTLEGKATRGPAGTGRLRQPSPQRYIPSSVGPTTLLAPISSTTARMGGRSPSLLALKPGSRTPIDD